MKKHIIIPVFVPHYGCQNACVFCDQRAISGTRVADYGEIRARIANILSQCQSFHKADAPSIEIAFFGGSFTAINRADMLKFLEISDEFWDTGAISEIRLSTRPDAIDEEVLDLLKIHHVSTIELGIQSFSDDVLLACRRGHTATQSKNACQLIKKHGFKLVGQMMCGLPSSTAADEVETAREIVALGADGARIYPTVVLDGTQLAKMQASGEYQPLTVEEAVDRCFSVYKIFAEAPLTVHRIGLCSNETLTRLNDSYHSAIGELVLNKFYLEKMEILLQNFKKTKGKTAVFTVKSGKISQAIGQKRSNKEKLIKNFALSDLFVQESGDLSPHELTLKIL